jgi:hypothetical protein
VAIPATVVIPVLREALPLPAQADVKLTVCGVARATPPIETVAVTLVVPKAERVAAPKLGVEIATVVAPIENPTDPVAATV